MKSFDLPFPHDDSEEAQEAVHYPINSLMGLPIEVKHQIFDFLSRIDQAHMCLVSKSCRAAVSTFSPYQELQEYFGILKNSIIDGHDQDSETTQENIQRTIATIAYLLEMNHPFVVGPFRLINISADNIKYIDQESVVMLVQVATTISGNESQLEVGMEVSRADFNNFANLLEIFQSAYLRGMADCEFTGYSIFSADDLEKTINHCQKKHKNYCKYALAANTLKSTFASNVVLNSLEVEFSLFIGHRLNSGNINLEDNNFQIAKTICELLKEQGVINFTVISMTEHSYLSIEIIKHERLAKACSHLLQSSALRKKKIEENDETPRNQKRLKGK